VKRPRAQGLAHSIQVRLKTKAEAESRPYAELLVLYAVERFLHRLGQSDHRQRFVLKGALLLRQWLGAGSRPTRDVDLLGDPGLNANGVRAFILDVLRVRVPDDGLSFDEGSLRVEPIREFFPGGGFRAKFVAYLGPMAVHYQVDVGIGAAVYPPPNEDVAWTGLLGLPVATLRAYTPYTALAEKLDALIVLGEANSRMKDFYDLFVLPARLGFDGATLTQAIRVCFAERSTEVPRGDPAGLRDDFAAEPLNAKRWVAFLNKARLIDAPEDLRDVLAAIRLFALPVLEAARRGEPLDSVWPPGGPWRDKGDS
jgi:hypothetical protein